MEPDLLAFEKEARSNGFLNIAGIDEAGRGPLAGPVVSAAVVLPRDFRSSEITDSKKLTPRQREKLFTIIYDQAAGIGIGIVDAVEIDRINILQATRLSMAFAVGNLLPAADYLLIDGNQTIACAVVQKALPKGDSLSLSISAASIVAKVTRDRLMMRYHEEFPEFGFDRHKGYPTAAHKAAVREFGPCLIHRMSFRGVREVVSFGPIFDGPRAAVPDKNQETPPRC